MGFRVDVTTYLLGVGEDSTPLRPVHLSPGTPRCHPCTDLLFLRPPGPPDVSLLPPFLSRFTCVWVEGPSPGPITLETG